MEMKTVKLKDICISITDGTHQAPPKSKNGVPFITISNITADNRLDYSVKTFVPTDFYESLNIKQKAKSGDILYSVVGSFGKTVFVNENKPFVFQRHIAILRPGDNVNNKYLYYILSSPDFYRKADLVALGAAQRTISLKNLRNMDINLPPRPIQDKIASILSAYDDMIDNCKQQIALLEEAAQRLYREWFVDLRFPGHETTPIDENGLPHGWTISNLKDFLKIKSGKDHKHLKSGNIPIYGSGGIMRYGDTALCYDKSILIPRKGSLNNILLVEGRFWTIDTMFYTEIEDINSIYFIYLQIKDWDLYTQNIGAAVPSMNTTILYAKDMLKPTESIIHGFNKIVEPYYNQIHILHILLKQLVSARDLLLPRLISGQIEINV